VFFLWKGLGSHLFVNVPRPGDSKGNFWSSSQASTYITSLTTQRYR